MRALFTGKNLPDPESLQEHTTEITVLSQGKAEIIFVCLLNQAPASRLKADSVRRRFVGRWSRALPTSSVFLTVASYLGNPTAHALAPAVTSGACEFK